MTCLLAALAFLAPSTVAPESEGPARGYLVIVGGGATGREITAKFRELAGGESAHIVMIPTANTDSQIHIDAIKKRGYPGVANFDVIHTRDRKIADSKEFVKPLLTATGVWLDGGRQWRLADAYLGTRTLREINAVLDRGGVVGGSSAGATIQGSFLIRGAAGANGADGDNRIMMSPDHLAGFGLLSNSAIDQHIITRHRENDLESVIKAHPELLGIGIDESTAIIVHGHEFEVIGKSKVAVWDRKDHSGKGYQFLASGQKFDMAKREIEK